MRNYLFVCFMALVITAGAQPSGTGNARTVREAEVLLRQLSASADFSSSFIGFSLRGPAGNELLAMQSEKSFVPASVMKVFTTLAVLDKLGGDTTFTTLLLHTGTVTADGTLTGSLIIKASGDPSLFSDRFPGYQSSAAAVAAWVAEIKKRGIKKVEGGVITDGSLFGGDPAADGWLRTDMGNYFAPGIHALAVNENRYEVHLASGARGTGVKLLNVVPDLDLLQFQNLLTADGTSDMAFLKSVPYSYDVFMDGTIPPGKSNFVIKGALPDPELFMAMHFTDALRSAGVEVKAVPATHRTLPGQLPATGMQQIDALTSPPLRDIVFHTNRRSVNIFAEHLLFAMSNGPVKTRKGGIDALNKTITGMGIDLARGFNQDDGCGLSLLNLCTPATLTRLLAVAQKKPYFKDFYRSLPVAGESGTLASFCKNTPASGKVTAKSGTMSGVKTYAGYVTGRSGTLYPFAVMVNNAFVPTWKVAKFMEPLMIKLTELE